MEHRTNADLQKKWLHFSPPLCFHIQGTRESCRLSLELSQRHGRISCMYMHMSAYYPSFNSIMNNLICLLLIFVNILGLSYSHHSLNILNLKELLTTDTELTTIAIAPNMGSSLIPKKGYNTPKAMGMPRIL